MRQAGELDDPRNAVDFTAPDHDETGGTHASRNEDRLTDIAIHRGQLKVAATYSVAH